MKRVCTYIMSISVVAAAITLVPMFMGNIAPDNTFANYWVGLLIIAMFLLLAFITFLIKENIRKGAAITITMILLAIVNCFAFAAILHVCEVNLHRARIETRKLTEETAEQAVKIGPVLEIEEIVDDYTLRKVTFKEGRYRQGIYDTEKKVWYFLEPEKR